MKSKKKKFKLKMPKEEVFDYQTKFKARKTYYKDKREKYKYKNKQFEEDLKY